MLTCRTLPKDDQYETKARAEKGLGSLYQLVSQSFVFQCGLNLYTSCQLHSLSEAAALLPRLFPFCGRFAQVAGQEARASNGSWASPMGLGGSNGSFSPLLSILGKDSCWMYLYVCMNIM